MRIIINAILKAYGAVAATILKGVLLFKPLRIFLLPIFNGILFLYLMCGPYITTVNRKRYQLMTALEKSMIRNLDKGYISKRYMARAIDNLFVRTMIGRKKKRKIIRDLKEKYGAQDPTFMVVAANKKCNLQCIGCYAGSTSEDLKLSYETFDRLITEAKTVLGQNFMVITGGEPFMYKDKGKTMFDLWEKHSDMFFMIYTNGTLITKEVAQKLAKLGNVSPAISVEGFEKETDQRRGKGVFKKIKKAMKNLREAGVPFGVSITVTSKNLDLLLKEKSYEYFIEDQGATYMWMFHLMPIGNAVEEFKLTITPKQRVELFREWEKLIKNKHYFIADFWNSGMFTLGCIAYGARGGYFYIDWDGKIMPCVFVPYYVDNLNDLYKEGKTVAHALGSDFFKRGRAWQKGYGKHRSSKPGNWLMPCSIRDHYANFKKNIITKDTKPEDKNAEKALASKAYEKKMLEFDKELTELTDPIWKKEFLKEKE